ncbi:MAG: hypothetical protein ABFD75_16280 [Smithella sp.]
MLDVLDRKIRQMHAALEALSSDDVLSVKPRVEITDRCMYVSIDFNACSDPIQLANMASLLIANIASLKDHLKVWCKSKNIPFNGESLINSNRSVALIHDLWNVDKHAELRSQSRSGQVPKLINLSKALSLSTGTEPNSAVIYFMDPRTGQMNVKSSGGGSAKIQLSGTIVDQAGNVLAEFNTACSEAVSAWEKELVVAGVPLPN